MDRIVEWMSRAGYAARGAVFAIVGGLALIAATGGESAQGSKGALGEVLDQPFGWALLGLLSLGLFAFALWRFIEAIADMDDEGDKPKGLAARAGQFFSGLTYGGLGLWAVRTAVSRSASDDQGGAQSLTQALMEQPFGGWLVMIAGLVVLAAAGAQAFKAAGSKATEGLRNEPRWAESVARVGIGARAVVFLIAGCALVYAGVRHDSEQAMGLEEALGFLQNQAFGPWLLGAVALGLLSFAVSCFVEARYGQVRRLSSKVSGNPFGVSFGR